MIEGIKLAQKERKKLSKGLSNLGTENVIKREREQYKFKEGNRK